MDDDAKIENLNNWIKFLNPEELKFHLVCASLYLTAYEMLIDAMLRFSKDFYTVGWDGTNDILSEGYKNSLKALYPKDIVIASAMWFHSKINCLDIADVELIKELKAYRIKEYSVIQGTYKFPGFDIKRGREWGWIKSATECWCGTESIEDKRFVYV